MTRAVVYYAPDNARSRIVASAMYKGIKLNDPGVRMISSGLYREPIADVALFYGLSQGLKRIFDDYRAAGRKAVYIDLGYWGRRKKTRFDGFHKLSLNDRHPTDYFQRVQHPGDRFAAHGVTIKPWRTDGKHVIVIGMSGKGALAEGFYPQAWEKQTVLALRAHTSRPIIYRPKPNDLISKPIFGATMQRGPTLEEALVDAWAIVCHHSNAAVEAILAGVPAICPFGVASVMAGHTLDQIENPPMPAGRAQWAADIAYCQWSLAEIERGDAWRHLKREGIV